jgi:hypothetical protein
VPFQILVDDARDFIEIVFPESPTPADVEEYAVRAQQMIESIRRPVRLLVDQSRVPVMPPALEEASTRLNRMAAKRGVVSRMARVVSTAVAALQMTRIGRETDVPLTSFTSREEAMDWLMGE